MWCGIGAAHPSREIMRLKEISLRRSTMSLVKTLAKVAVGVVVANSVKGMMGGGARGQTMPRTGRVGRASSGGGLEDLLGQVLGGGASGGGPAPGGNLQDMLGQVLGGRAGGAGSAASMGGLLDQLSKLSRPGADTEGTGGEAGFGRRLDQALSHFGEPETAPTGDEEQLAGVLIRAMVQAAKADGRIDAQEKKALLDQLGDVSQEEQAFVERELERSLDAKGLAAETPRGSEEQVYMVSVMAIELDDQREAKYLHELAKALQLDPARVNAIHDKLDAPHIYR